MAMVNVALNGVRITDISPHIIVQEINESAPSTNITAVSVAGCVGQRVTQQERRYMDVSVKFSIALLKNAEPLRASILNAVNEWAVGAGNLSVSYRDNMHLTVMCAAQLAPGSLRKWNSDYTIIFRAYNVPYWENDMPDAAETDRGSATLHVTGNTRTPLCATIKNVSDGLLTYFDLTANGKKMTFDHMDSLGLTRNKVVRIEYENGLLVARNGDNSLLSYRTTDSADDLWVNPGRNSVTFRSSSGASCECTARAFGRWL